MNKDNRMELNWPQAKQFNKSIRREFSIYVSLIILGLMSITGFIITDQYVKSATENAIEKLLVQARSFSGPAGKHILSADGPDVLMLNNICKKLKEDNCDVYWVGVAGNNQQYLAHTDINQVISENKIRTITNFESVSALRTNEIFSMIDDTIFICIPILENGIDLGNLAVAASTEQIHEAKYDSIITVLTITVAMLLLGLPLTLIVLHRKLRPIGTITNYLKNISFDNINLKIPLESKNEFGYLAETLRVMGLRLNAAQDERIEKERMDREYEIARDIQANILPHKFPVGDGYEFAGMYKSAREVGGDYYDFIDFDDDHVAFLVADVSGKSLPGMLVMLLIRDIVKQVSLRMIEPARLLSEVNREIIPHIKKGMFVTMFFGLLNKNNGDFTFASAGHNPLIRISQLESRSELIKTKGFPLGLMPPDQFDKRIETGRIRLIEGDWLIQYSDGVNEALNSSQEEFGMVRFINALDSSAKMNPAELINNTLRAHSQFVGKADQYDDITLLAMKWTNRTGRSQKNSMEMEKATSEN